MQSTFDGAGLADASILSASSKFNYKRNSNAHPVNTVAVMTVNTCFTFKLQ